MVEVSQDEVIKFIQYRIMHRFGIPKTVITNQVTTFTWDKMVGFAQQFGIKLIYSTPYYAQANFQAEATNKIIIGSIKKNIEDKPRKWHETHFGHDIVLPLKTNLFSIRVTKQHLLDIDDYQEAMLIESHFVDDDRLVALNKIQLSKLKMAKLQQTHETQKVC